MGAWGYGAFENDTACDLMDSLLNVRLLKKFKKSKFDDHDYNEARVIAEMIYNLRNLTKSYTFFSNYDIGLGIISCLEQMVNDKNWIDSWDNKDSAKKMINRNKRIIKYLKEYYL